MNNNNYCVIMAGGVGSRFWPFSTNHRPKQFLDFFGTGRSLLQMTVDRFRPLVPIENVLIVTNVMYRDLILEQIPDMQANQVLCEPARRNTAPCIAYAVSNISARQQAKGDGLNANIVVAPSDHLILQEAKFIDTIRTGFEFVEQHDALLTLGMKPTRPETGYGYIQVDVAPAALGEAAKPLDGTLLDGLMGTALPVKTFTEKPHLELAKMFYESGEFLWNSGIFIWNLRTIRQAFRDFLPEVADKFLAAEPYMMTAGEEAYINEMFPTCPNVSIDYGVMEKASGVHVIPASFGWSDLGTWGSLYELSDKDENRNVTLHCESAFYESEGNIVTLENGKLAVLQGMHDMIVAESGNVLLICQKSAEQHIREFVNDANVRFDGKYN